MVHVVRQLCAVRHASACSPGRRNPALHAADFVLPSGSAAEHPFPIVGTALIGPTRLAPFRRDLRAVQYQVLLDERQSAGG
jgi:hypothetical protein